VGRVGEEKRRRKKMREEIESEERRCNLDAATTIPTARRTS